MKIFNFIKGKQGENLAQEYLEKNGYKIIQKNYRTKFAEIDIIAKKDNILSFIEVKSRNSDSFGRPYEAVSESKIKKIRKNAEIFLSTTDINYDGISFDIIEVFLGNKTINHIKSAF
jgi:TIGR00252 family protein